MTRQSLVDHMRNVHKISIGNVIEAAEGSIKDYFGKAGKIVRGTQMVLMMLLMMMLLKMSVGLIGKKKK